MSGIQKKSGLQLINRHLKYLSVQYTYIGTLHEESINVYMDANIYIHPTFRALSLNKVINV
jgi:hypothetical protein